MAHDMLILAQELGSIILPLTVITVSQFSVLEFRQMNL